MHPLARTKLSTQMLMSLLMFAPPGAAGALDQSNDLRPFVLSVAVER